MGFDGAYLSIFSVFCGWSGLSWQRLSVVNWRVLGGRVRGVYDHGPLRAAAVLAAAGLVSLPTSIPGDQDVCKECDGYFRKTGPVFSYISNSVYVIYKQEILEISDHPKFTYQPIIKEILQKIEFHQQIDCS